MAVEHTQPLDRECWIRSDNQIGATLLSMQFVAPVALFPLTLDPTARLAFAKRAVREWRPGLDAFTREVEIQKLVQSAFVWSIPLARLPRRPREDTADALKRHASKLLPPQETCTWETCTEAVQKARLRGTPVPVIIVSPPERTSDQTRILMLEDRVAALTARIEALEGR
jgi:hypothetical protein